MLSEFDEFVNMLILVQNVSILFILLGFMTAFDTDSSNPFKTT